MAKSDASLLTAAAAAVSSAIGKAWRAATETAAAAVVPLVVLLGYSAFVPGLTVGAAAIAITGCCLLAATDGVIVPLVELLVE